MYHSDIVCLFRSVSVLEFPQWYSDVVSLFRSVSVPEFPQRSTVQLHADG